MLLSAISFGTAISIYGTVNVGFEVTNFAGGAPRTAFSFSLGVCLFHVLKIVKLPKTSPFIWMGLLFALLLIPFSGEEYRMLCIAAFFPTIILYAAQTEFRKSWQAPAETLGNLSYPLYATHAPIVLILRFPFSQAGAQDFIVCIAVCCLGCVAAALFFARYWDAPVRQILRGSLLALPIADRRRISL